jgi:undecaprenyl diphosphate synthase
MLEPPSSPTDLGTFHVAIIMDGNGRWATSRGLPRVEGHRRGADAVRRTVRAAPGLGISTLTLFAFSSDNWKRPPREVATLLRLFADYLRSERSELLSNGVRLSVIGRRDRLTASLSQAITEVERATAAETRLHLRLAIDYSSRGAILAAASDPSTASASISASPDVDLLIRTGGERRLSDFLLWESAYAELCFLARMWPDFAESDLSAAVADFHTRQRRFGGLTSGPPLAARAAESPAALLSVELT